MGIEMGLVTTEAILLDVRDLQEQDRIVTFLTSEHGKKRGVARGSKRKYSRFAGQLQPLAKVRATWFEKEGRELVRISSLELLRAADRLYRDLEGILLGSYLAGNALEFAQDNEENEYLFRLLDTTTNALCEGVERNLAARFYEAWVLRLAGVFPPPAECPTCGGDLLTKKAAITQGAEGLLCRECAGGEAKKVSRGTVEFLLRIGGENLRRLGASPPSVRTLAEVEDVNARVRRAFLQDELKSYRVLKETLQSLPRES
ncbi:MAG: DNA repair protein RecO [Acidobacteriota bacterium]|nr:DNA repair protein RecO [Acidobacteriota bacterium]